MDREIDVAMASRIYGLSDEALKRIFRKEGFRSTRKEGNKWMVKRSEIEWRKLRDKTSSIQILTEFSEYSELAQRIKPSITQLEAYFGGEPGCLAAIVPGGVHYMLLLLEILVGEKAMDVSYVAIGETEPFDEALIHGTRVLVVDDVTNTGRALRKAMELIEHKRVELGLVGVRSFVYDDFAGIADYYVRRSYDEFFNTLSLNLK